MSKYAKEIEKRRTFAIISHPDAGKTTLTEKFLLYGGAINLAGSVKSGVITSFQLCVSLPNGRIVYVSDLCDLYIECLKDFAKSFFCIQ